VTEKSQAKANAILSPKVVDDLAEIARRSGKLVELYADRLKKDDGYQVVN
jgi:hypothetical protein